ncbi:hypothetical protein [Streptomyces oceani]|uniref:Secreted protein n=1 Tax=Streptomyces oceani TaxID=1075402 RepID=A0A1E7KMK2_9ACTN|nr:hypothetical protein [Streptomyces oceani]OEV05143.1 hypothetical protein AN216_03920 [Streptomyces oceani]
MTRAKKILVLSAVTAGFVVTTAGPALASQQATSVADQHSSVETLGNRHGASEPLVLGTDAETDNRHGA